MKKLMIFSLIVVFVSQVEAQKINGSFSSMFYAYENYLDLNNSTTFLRAFQILNMNISEDSYSVKTRLSFETDLNNINKDNTNFRIYNFYLEKRNLFDYFTLRLGRQSIINGFGGSFDGANIVFDYNSNLKLTGYIGGNVPAYQKLGFTNNLKEDYIFGFLMSGALTKNFNYQLSFTDKHFKPEEYYSNRLDADFNPVNFLIRKNSRQFRLFTSSFSYEKEKTFNFQTKFNYDFNFKAIAKFELYGKYYFSNQLSANLLLNYREPNIPYNSIFAVFNFGNSKEIEGGIDFRFNQFNSLSANFGHVTFNENNSGRLSIAYNFEYGNISYRKTFGYAGELDAVSIFASKPLWDDKITPSVGLSFTNYKLSEKEETQNLTSLLGGINFSLVKNLSFDLQTQYFNNKFYKNDLRFLLKINYWFNTNL